jgi:hypothetical protein
MVRFGEAMKHRLLALDVDGTLIGPDSVVSSEIIDAVAVAQRGGLLVCLATGRSWVETVPVWRQLRLSEPHLPLVTVGGAMVCEPEVGRTLYHRPIPRQLADSFVEALAGAGYSAMALVDSWRNGFDYLLVERGDVERARRLWLSKTRAAVRAVGRLPRQGPRVLRISAVVEAQAGDKLAEEMRRRFDGQLNVHSILAPNYGVFVVEAHAVGADKFSAVRYVAQAQGIGAGAIVAVGDDVNDLAMIRGAGLGVAMPQAPAAVRQAARCVAEAGLAAFILELAGGKLETD